MAERLLTDPGLTIDAFRRLRDEVDELRDKVNAHEVRLENGRHTFSALRDELRQAKALMPRPISALKVSSLTLGIMLASGGALWSLASHLGERPTAAHVQEVFATHNQSGHRETSVEIRDIQRQQTEQRVLMERVIKDQAEQSHKIDQLLDRVPDRPRRR